MQLLLPPPRSGSKSSTPGPWSMSHGLKLEIVLNYCQYGALYLGSYYNTGPYIHFPHFGNSNLGKLPFASFILWLSVTP